MKNKINSDDLVLATSGGELGTIKLAAKLKAFSRCKVVYNFRDPLEYASYKGYLKDHSFHVSREKVEKKYLEQADLIITSSHSYRENLESKYTHLKERIHTNHFGYFSEPLDSISKQFKNKIINICYMGTMTSAQSPELLIKAYMKLPELNRNKLKLTFIGEHKSYRGFDTFRNIDGIDFINYMSKSSLDDYIKNNVDVGFVSLTSEYYGACVPSKIYEYLNYELPILAALPKGDGEIIINSNLFGVCCHYQDLEALSKNIIQISQVEFLNKVCSSIRTHKNEWSMGHKISELNQLLKYGS